VKKYLALMLTVALSGLHALPALAQRRPVRRTTPRPTVAQPAPATAPVPPQSAYPQPVFLSRKGAASLGEMMSQPSAFSYGSSINVWLVADDNADGKMQIREVGVTGHGDSPTCRHVSAQVLGMLIDKNRETEDLFVAGAAHLVDSGDPAQRAALEEDETVRAYLSEKDDLDYAKALVELYERAPGTATDGKTALEQARADQERIKQRLQALSMERSVLAYLRQSKSTDSIKRFVTEVTDFSLGNGLVSVHVVPFEAIQGARARIDAAVRAGKPVVVSFEDLPPKKIGEAALFTPVLTIPDARPLELRIPYATLNVPAFKEALSSNRDEVEKAIVGNASQRLAFYLKMKQDFLKDQAWCKRLPPEALQEVVELGERFTEQALQYTVDKTQRSRMTLAAYCQSKVPQNLHIADKWIGQAKGLLEKINEDAKRQDGSLIQESTYATLVDSMLRDWRLPVARSQVAFDAWRRDVRGPVWAALAAELERKGIARDLIGGEQMIFSVRRSGEELVVRPMHVIDMARSVVIVDPAAGATRVLDAWSLRSPVSAEGVQGAGPAQEVAALVRGSTGSLAAGDEDGARTRLASAFSQDPGAAFSQLEGEWLSLFPDTRQHVTEMQRSLAPLVEAVEWYDAYERLETTPTSKENLKQYAAAYEDLLESYPKAPIDLHLRFAIDLADLIAAYQRNIDTLLSALFPAPAEGKAWDVIEAYGQQLPAPLPGRNAPVVNSSGETAKARQARRLRVLTMLRNAGIKDARYREVMADSVERRLGKRGFTLAAAQDRFLDGRRLLGQDIEGDPAALILKAVETIKRRDPAYWEQARAVTGMPKVRSQGWDAAMRERERQLTLFEVSAQSLIRLEGTLQKSYWGARRPAISGLRKDLIWAS
jgi:hypothetical protein